MSLTEQNKTDIRDLLLDPLARRYQPNFDFPTLVANASEYLKENFGVGDMTLIEKCELRECCESAGRLYYRQLCDLVENPYSEQVVPFLKEAAWYWLMQTLGICVDTICNNLDDESWCGTPEFQQWIQIERDRRNLKDIWG